MSRDGSAPAGARRGPGAGAAPRTVAPGEADGFPRLTAKIRAESGFVCDSYKDGCLRRRIAVRMRARAVHTFDDYGRVLDADAGEWERLLDALTINVTRLFRDAEAFAAVARHVVPALWAAERGPLRVWSAGCASGEEAYSLAALFHRHADAIGEAREVGRVQVLGSDIDRASLAAAAAGRFPEHAFTDTPADLRARYFTGHGPATASPELRALVRFERRDLLHEAPPPGPHHLIACRNVLIYFDHQTQERLLVALRDALAPGGFLVLGRVETLLGEARHGLAMVVPRERIFRRT
jgi:chemotaxis protein methyltransferase CheR